MQTFNYHSSNSEPALNRPIRVLFVHPSDELYGSDTVLLNLLIGLDRQVFEPYVILANDLPYKGLLSAELRRHNIPVFQLPIGVARRKYLTPRGLPQFAINQRTARHRIGAFIVKHDIDVVYSNTLAVWTGAQAAQDTKRPHVWHVHEIVQQPATLRRYLQWLVPRTSQTIACVSQATLDGLLIDPRARAKGAILRNGLDPTQWLNANGRQRVRTELGCQEDDVLVGFVGRISDFKAPDLFVQAAIRTLQDRPNVRFFLAGDSVPGQREMWNRVTRLIAESATGDRIHMLGFRHDVADLDAALDVLVAPSRGLETCSLVSVQAMFAAKPVVATDVGAMRETVADGETGFVVPTEDWQAIAQAVIHLVDNAEQRRTLGLRGQARALGLFTLDRQIAEFHRILAAAAQTARQQGAEKTRPSSPS